MTAARLVALDDAIMAVIRDAQVPISTPEIAAGVGYRVSGHQAVYHRLRRLESRGRVVKVRLDGWRAVFWDLPVRTVDAGGRL